MPTKVQIKVYLNVVKRLARFEAEQRVFRGHGLFTETELDRVIPDIKVVREWLEVQGE